MQKEMVIINYSDVCKNNFVIDQLKQHFTIEEENTDLYYGYAKIMIDEIEFDIKVDRRKTNAGNQYIEFYVPCQEKLKMPIGKPFDIISFKKKLSNLANKEKARLQRMNEIQEYRKKIYLKFHEINKNPKLTLHIKNGESKEIEINGYYQFSITKHFSYFSYEKQFNEVREYYKKYEEEQKEISTLLTILKEVK